jgi:hypothetical protein
MSWFNGSVPEDCRECQTRVEMVIVPRTVDIGGFEVHRALPFKKKQMASLPAAAASTSGPIRTSASPP